MKTPHSLILRLAILLQSVSLLCASGALALDSQGSYTGSVDYDYPYNNQLISTLTGAVAHATMPSKTMLLEVRPERREVPLLEGRNKVVLHYMQQPNAAPLMFIIPGLGGFSGSGGALLLAETYFKAGYSVVTLPSNFSWQYALQVSASAIPGYLPRDAAEYYQFMQVVTMALKNQKNFQITSFALSGFSLGGTLAAFVADQDSHQHHFNFQKVILINPAVDMAYGIEVLDRLQAAGDTLSVQQKTDDMSFAFNLGADLLEAPMNTNTFQQAVPKLSRLSENEIRWLIGQTFRQSLRDVIITSQRVHNTGLLKTPENKFHSDNRLSEAAQFTYAQYMDLVVFPTLVGNTSSKAEALQQSSLYALAPLLKSNPNILVFENADDLIIKPSDIQFFRDVMPNRFKLYPHGGHLGNLWWGQNQKDLNHASSFVQ